MGDNRDNIPKWVYLLGLFPTIWLSLLIAPSVNGGLPQIIKDFPEKMASPFSIYWCNNSLKVIVILVVCYAMAIGIYLSTKKNYRRREEHGSAKWGNASVINKKYEQKPISENKLLTQNVALGLNGKKHRRNLNVLVCGGSGAGKTRFYCKPNIMQTNTSFVILDPKGEIVRDTGYLLEQKGYEVKVLDLINMEKSHCYNPFVYLKTDNDVQKLVTNLFKATTPKGSSSNDPFWDTAASMLLLSLIFYLKYEAPDDEKNFPMVMELLRAGEVHEDDDTYISPLDVLFNRLEAREPEHIAVKYYRDYHSGSAKTLKSIQITLAARLEKFNLESLASLTITDELDLPSLGEKKVALFALIPDNDTSFNFLVSILYTQLFQQLFFLADHKYGGSLPVHVHFVMDEFANVSLPDDFDKILSVMRSREVSVSIILQNLAQLKALFEKQWESIVGNCDEFLYLGGNEQSTHKYVSELLGKETIDTNTYGKSSGRSGNYSTNYQISGRELMTPDEVRLLDNKYALLFIRGERPIMDFKYDILKHPNVALTTDGKAKPYLHGGTENAIASIILEDSIDNYDFTNIEEIANVSEEYEIISSEDIDEYLKEKEIRKNMKKKNNIQLSNKGKKLFKGYVMAVSIFTLTIGTSMGVLAADDPMAVVNNLSDFIFGLIRAIGMILLGFGIVQVGLSLKSHDPSQRANGFLTVAGGIIITFAKEILNMITG
jgi:type IV secretion system protein VirD4